MKDHKKPTHAMGDFKPSVASDPHIPGTDAVVEQPVVEVAAKSAELPRQDQQIMEAIRNAMTVDGRLQEGRIFINAHGESHVEVTKAIPNQKHASFGVYKLV